MKRPKYFHRTEEDLQSVFASLSSLLQVYDTFSELSRDYKDPLLRNQVRATQKEIRDIVARLLARGISIPDLVMRFGKKIYIAQVQNAEDDLEDKEREAQHEPVIADLVNEKEQLRTAVQQQQKEHEHYAKMDSLISQLIQTGIPREEAVEAVLSHASKGLAQRQNQKLFDDVQQMILTIVRPQAKQDVVWYKQDLKAVKDLGLPQGYSGGLSNLVGSKQKIDSLLSEAANRGPAFLKSFTRSFLSTATSSQVRAIGQHFGNAKDVDSLQEAIVQRYLK